MQVTAALEALSSFSSGWVGVEDAVALVECPTVAQMQLTGEWRGGQARLNACHIETCHKVPTLS
jgi:hypothetical protein